MKQTIGSFKIIIAKDSDCPKFFFFNNRDIYSTHLYVYNNIIRKNHTNVQHYTVGSYISDFELDLVLKYFH